MVLLVQLIRLLKSIVLNFRTNDGTERMQIRVPDRRNWKSRHQNLDVLDAAQISLFIPEVMKVLMVKA